MLFSVLKNFQFSGNLVLKKDLCEIFPSKLSHRFPLFGFNNISQIINSELFHRKLKIFNEIFFNFFFLRLQNSLA